MPWRPPSGPPVRNPNAIFATAPKVATGVVFPVPPAVRPLLHAAHRFVVIQDPKSRQRLLTPPAATPQQFAAAAAKCGITLPTRPGDLVAAWQLRVTCRDVTAPTVCPAHPMDPAARSWFSDPRDAWALEGYPRGPERSDLDGEFARAPLTATAAAGLLHLIHCHQNGIPRGFSGASWLLLRRQLAFHARDPGGTQVLTPHPDVLFALRLTEYPGDGVEHPAFGTHNDL